MPELPEVETMVRGIRPFVTGREIVAVRKCRCPCKPITMTPTMRQISKRTKGKTITAVRRIAKRVVLELSSGDVFVIEPRMTGMMVLENPPNQGHLRVQWCLDSGGEYDAFWFWDRRGLGTVRLYGRAEMEDALGPDKLGPDALEMTELEWRQRCAKTSRAIKVALLDQKLTAGIGNLYASEILHAARIHPAHAAHDLKPRHFRRLQESTQQILRTAIKYEGSTLNDGTYSNALNQSGRYQNAHRVYNRENETCPTCGKAEIVRIVQAQRSTFFCPVCQRS